MTRHKTVLKYVAILSVGFLTGFNFVPVTKAFAQSKKEAAKYWHQWRGPDANGVSQTANPPSTWSETKNIKWKIKLDGNGSSAPIVWENKVFLLTAINTGVVDPKLPKPEDQPKRIFGITHPNTLYKFVVLCLDRTTGKEIWRKIATEKIPHQGHHGDNDFASASPTTDGERLYCWFGSAGLYCYDLDGKKLWERDLGKAFVGASLGEGTSPVVHKDKLVIVRDHSRQSMIHVLNSANGKTVWEKKRDEPNTWATPAIVEHSGKTQVITTGSNFVRSYDLSNGDIIWKCSGLTGNCIPCPIVSGDFVYCMSGYEGFSLLAIQLSSQGDVSNSDSILWQTDRGTPYIPSPVLYNGMLYFTQSNRNVMTCLDVKDGSKIIDRTRLPSLQNIYASPLGAGDKLYFTGRNGTTLVLKQSKKFEVIATNRLNEEINSSPAVVGNQLLIRGTKSLYCIESAE